MAHKILIADDEQDILNMLSRYLTMKGYEVITALDGEQTIEKIKCSPDIILLDVNMPKANGIDICRRIRSLVTCPVLFLSAMIEDNDKIKGFEAGGDDYIEKPFSLPALDARIRAHLRREQRPKKAIHKVFGSDLIIDYSAKQVKYKDTLIPFVKKEFKIIELLSLNVGQVFDKEHIYETLWGYDADGNSSTIAEHIRRIRMKFKAAGCKDIYIETVWGYGYRWKR